MGLPWFADRKKNAPVESPRPQSRRFSTFSSISSPTSKSGKRNLFRGCRKKSSRKTLLSGSGGLGFAPWNCSLPSAAELESVFNKFDANGDGKISSSELGDILRSLGNDTSEEELRLMMAEADSDGDGYVDLSEFVALNTNGVDSAALLRDLKDAFNMFDADSNGNISAEELHNVLRKLGESCTLAECHNMIGGIDVDGDGQVSFDEFFEMMTAPKI
uniref:TSA: Wollemia nobilis Ref_Wollemi_Transcript_4143_1211 transcribed RNA sequence n=1 Tax=Wollemia nobilis TaxID=56998 RepID=A0A0C9QWJ3_9CONI